MLITQRGSSTGLPTWPGNWGLCGLWGEAGMLDFFRCMKKRWAGLLLAYSNLKRSYEGDGAKLCLELSESQRTVVTVSGWALETYSSPGRWHSPRTGPWEVKKALSSEVGRHDLMQLIAWLWTRNPQRPLPSNISGSIIPSNQLSLFSFSSVSPVNIWTSWAGYLHLHKLWHYHNWVLLSASSYTYATK